MRGLSSAVITFPTPPRQVIHPDCCPQLLTTCQEKIRLLATTGIDYCLMLAFTPEVARYNARHFMALLKERYRIEALVIGHDHRFGHNRSETPEDYARYGLELGMEVIPARAYTDSGTTISSSAIRRLVAEGEVAEAAGYLGYDYSLEGKVIEGHQVGRTLGFPTANLQPDHPAKIIPADGAYAVRAYIDGTYYDGMLNIGHRPTLDNGDDRSIEVHLFHFHADIYNRQLQVSFVRRIRAEQQFASVEELAAQLHKDAAAAAAILANYR